MSYVKTTWTAHETKVTAAAMNHIEDGIEANDSAIAANIITDNVSNQPVASVHDGANDMPVADLVIGIEAVQGGSGDPSPTNVRAISGWTTSATARFPRATAGCPMRVPFHAQPRRRGHQGDVSVQFGYRLGNREQGPGNRNIRRCAAETTPIEGRQCGEDRVRGDHYDRGQAGGNGEKPGDGAGV